MKELTVREVETVSGAGVVELITGNATKVISTLIDKPFRYAGEAIFQPVGSLTKGGLDLAANTATNVTSAAYNGVTGVVSGVYKGVTGTISSVLGF